MTRQRIDYKTREERERIEALLRENETTTLPYIPDVCTNACILRQKGFCMMTRTLAPKHGESCHIDKERR